MPDRGIAFCVVEKGERKSNITKNLITKSSVKISCVGERSIVGRVLQRLQFYYKKKINSIYLFVTIKLLQKPFGKAQGMLERMYTSFACGNIFAVILILFDNYPKESALCRFGKGRSLSVFGFCLCEYLFPVFGGSLSRLFLKEQRELAVIFIAAFDGDVGKFVFRIGEHFFCGVQAEIENKVLGRGTRLFAEQDAELVVAVSRGFASWCRSRLAMKYSLIYEMV